MTVPPAVAPQYIRIRGARQHNLRDIDLDIPRGQLTVITGVSGSGKSSLAFDTLYAEGQRRYVESVSAYAKQFLDRLPRPDVDSIQGLTPAVSIQQVAPARSARSTVGTATEMHDYLRLLFARLGTVHCGKCARPVSADSPRTIAREAAGWVEDALVLVLAPVHVSGAMSWDEHAGHLLKAGYTRVWLNGEVTPLDPAPKLAKGTKSVLVVMDRFRWHPDESSRLVEACEQAFRRGEGRLELIVGGAEPARRSERWECSNCGEPAMQPEPGLFSFNSPLGVCPACKGFGDVLTFAPDLIVSDESKTLRDGAIEPWAKSWRTVTWPKLQKLSEERGVPLDKPWRELSEEHRQLLMHGDKKFRGAIPFLEKLQEKSYKAGNRFIVKRYQQPRRCTSCGGTRLRAEALRVKLGGRTIADVCAGTVAEVADYIGALEFGESERQIAGTPLAELQARLRFLLRVDLGYLTLDRLMRTLSGGEAQRIELANALGANLADTLYVLDEPTVGLHPRDTERLIGILHELADRGNTLVVVEHEPMVIRAASHLVDLGPGAGEQGGRLLYAGPAARRDRGSGLRDRALAVGREACDARAREGEAVRIPHDPRRARAQPQERDGAIAVRTAERGDRSFGLGQEHADRGRAASRRREALRRARGRARRRARLDRGARQVPARRDGGPVPDRADATLVPGDVHERLRAAARNLRAAAGGARARLEGRRVLVQHRGRALRALRGRGLGAGRDVLPRRPVGAVRGVRRRPLQARAARGALPRQEHQGSARHDRRRGVRAFRDRAQVHARASRAAPRRAGLPAARPAREPAVGRRGAAPEDRARTHRT
ncbi:MAG: hypothetical protein IPJ04_12930 [Candidatus Eisenbacteria bacterium]|nr:hypothetical protein [Candidatus Eisenbacteria bacterium]